MSKPPTASLVSANGPSVTIVFPSRNLSTPHIDGVVPK
jgi:hypothetical protein